MLEKKWTKRPKLEIGDSERKFLEMTPEKQEKINQNIGLGSVLNNDDIKKKHKKELKKNY